MTKKISISKSNRNTKIIEKKVNVLNFSCNQNIDILFDSMNSVDTLFMYLYLKLICTVPSREIEGSPKRS